MDKNGKPFLSAFPKELVASKLDQEMTLKLKNGSIYQVAGTDNIDSLVGTNPIGIVFSEYSLQDPHAFDFLRPILNENEGWAWFNFTPRGRNHGATLFDRAVKNPNWFAERLTVDDTGIIPLSAIDEDRELGMAEEIIQQEYWCSFDAPLVGAYYSKQMTAAANEGRIGLFPYDPMLPVQTAWDLGIDDSTAIWFYQVYPDAIKIIDFYENSGEGLLHYIKELDKKPYAYGDHWAPHDIEVREMSTGRSRREFAIQHGLRFRVCPKMDVADGIEAVRGLLPTCYFNNTEPMEMGIEAMKQYQKEWDDKRKVYGSRPLHDWTSHAADAFRVLAFSVRTNRNKKIILPRQSLHDYNII